MSMHATPGGSIPHRCQAADCLTPQIYPIPRDAATHPILLHPVELAPHLRPARVRLFRLLIHVDYEGHRPACNLIVFYTVPCSRFIIAVTSSSSVYRNVYAPRLVTGP